MIAFLIVGAAVYLLVGAGFTWKLFEDEPPPFRGAPLAAVFALVTLIWVPLLLILFGRSLWATR